MDYSQSDLTEIHSGETWGFHNSHQASAVDVYSSFCVSTSYHVFSFCIHVNEIDYSTSFFFEQETT